MKNMNIKGKLIASFVVVVILTAIVGIVGIVAASSLSSSGSLLNARATIGIDAMNLQAIVYEQRGQTRGIALYVALFDTEEAQKQKDGLAQSVSKAGELIEQIKSLASTETTKAMISDIEEQRKDYSAAREVFLASVDAAEKLESDTVVGKGKGMESAIEAAMSVYAPHITPYIEKIEKLAVAMNESTDEQYASMAALSSAVSVILIVVLVVAIVSAVFIALYIADLIATPITRIVSWIKQTGNDGNLIYPQVEWDYCDELGKQKDEIGVLSDSYGKMLKLFLYYKDVLDELANQNLAVDVKVIGANDNIGNALKTTFASLNDAFESVNDATSEVQSGAGQISDSAQMLAQGSTEQAATVEQLSASIQNIALQTDENSRKANEAAQLADGMKANAEKGSSQMLEMTNAVQEISKASQDISKVIKVIDDIAFQTNILALNAAVEAARAGEAGKGFAVVADEVRSLASKSAQAAKETGELIENSMKKAELGARIAAETSASLSDIVSGINESTEKVAEIAKSSEEQSEAIAQINDGIDQVSQVVQQNSATAEQSAASSEELNAQSAVLARNVAKFKLRQA